MPKPLVSVIVPTYNCGRFVGDAIESVLSQSYEPLEVVVVDDGSTDETVRVVGQYGERVRFFSQLNSGPAAARNRAVREARGDYLAFLDGDDLWLPGQPQVLMSYIDRQPEAKVVFGDWIVWRPDADGTYPTLRLPEAATHLKVDPEASGWIYTKLLFDSVIHIIAAVVHRSVYDKVGGFDETLRTGSDYDFWLKVSRQVPVVKLRYPVAIYRHNPESVTYAIRNDNNPYRLLTRALEAYGLADDAGNRADSMAVASRLADLAFTHAYRHYWHGDPTIAQRWFFRALANRPWDGKAAVYLIAALAKRWGLFTPSRGRTGGQDVE